MIFISHQNFRTGLSFFRTILLLVVFGLTFISNAIAQEWKVFESEEGGFSVLTPALMETKHAIVSTGIGEIEVHTYFLNPKDTLGNYLYLINYYDLPEDLIPKDSLALRDEFLKNTLDQSIEDIDGSLMYSAEIQIGKHTGLMWRSRSESGIVKCRAYIIDNRFYMLQVFSVESKSLNKFIDKFLESFTIHS
jgi:hypothetical protein